ncbi:MAG TPA: NAD(P)H-binding protein [Ktedonobacteraceae bacterium]|nr:NAD(P)H-binding protein [Ktedonobacteraceae bacterium]
MTNVLVTGGAGRLGRKVVKELTATGYRVRIMSRKPQPANLLSATEWAQADLETGLGIADAVTGIDVVVHTASSPFKHTRQIDIDGTRLLLEQARVAGVAHVIYISIAGIDRIPYAYYRAKLAAEELVQKSDIPWSLLRATQFHYLVDRFFQAATKLPLVTLFPTDLQCQSVAESEVASRLCELVAAGPRGRLVDLGGPEVLTAGEMMYNWLKLRGLHRRVLPFHVPGKVAQGFRRGYNTCPDQPVHGRITWTEWVQSKHEVQ